MEYIRRRCRIQRDNDNERDYGRKTDRERDREREKGRDHERDRDHGHARDLDYDRDRERDRRHRDRDGDRDHKVEAETGRVRAQSHQVQEVDTTVSGTRRRASPSPSSHGGIDDYRHLKQDDMKYRNSVTEQKHRGNSSREVTGYSGVSERGSKYRSAEKPVRLDDGDLRDLPIEKTSNSKPSPMTLVERSPPSTSLERKYTNRSGIRRSHDAEEAGWRSGASGGSREKSTDRFSRDLLAEKPPTNAHTRKRQGTAWRPPQNWSPALPNDFMSFQYGPPHGGFQTMMSPFPSPMFGMRLCMDMSYPGLPYYIPEAEGFSSHLRPLGWPWSAPSNLYGWNGNNVVFGDETHMYGPPEWDQNRHPTHGRGWESSSYMWKGQNGDMGMKKSQKEDYSMQNDDSHIGTVEAKSLLKSTEEEKPGSEDDNSAHCCCAYLRNLDISSELAGPQLYGQCMSLLEMEESATTDEESNAIINLKDGGRVIPKGSIMSLSPSFLPAANDSVFQRAMNHYRNQREETGSIRIFNCKTLDLISSLNQDRLGKKDKIGEVERAEEKAEELDPIISEVKLEEMNPIIDKDKETELDPNVNDEVQSGDQTSSLIKLEEPDDVPSLKEPITGEAAIPGTEDDMDCCSSLENIPEIMSVYDGDGAADVKMEAASGDRV